MDILYKADKPNNQHCGLFIMNYIISKGGTIARYTKSGSTLILRTPITKTLQPDGRAVYQVAGNYDKYGNPTSGFIE